MRKSRVGLYLLSRRHLLVCACCTLPLLTYVVLRGKLMADSQSLAIARAAALLTGMLSMWALIRALSSRIPQMGAPYYSDDGTLSALPKEQPRDLSIPWSEVAVICTEFLLFAGVWILVFAEKTQRN